MFRRPSAKPSRRDRFEPLIEPLLKPLYNTALGYLRDRDDAEDAVQETLVRAYRAFDQFEDGTNFKAWVFRILTNYCINRHRRHERRRDTASYEDVAREADLAGSEMQSPSALPTAALLDGMVEEEVEDALKALPLDFRVVVVLSDVQEFSYREIAEVLEIPIGTVRSRLFRARRMLRLALTEYALERGYLRESDLGQGTA